MMAFNIALLSVFVWVGTAGVDVMIWEPGGEHPYTTDFELEYREAGRTPIHDSKGTLVGHRVRLFPRRIALKVHHQVRGLLNCTGAGEEVVTDGPDAELVLPLPGIIPGTNASTPYPSHPSQNG